jgi:cell fate regulator YaaT (PSP1 superfamily)
MELAVKIISNGRITAFGKTNLNLSVGDEVLLEQQGCLEKGIICDLKSGGEGESCCDKNCSAEEAPVIIRKLNESDAKKYSELKKKAKDCIPECLKKIESHGLEMELLDAELSFDEKKLTFYFSAPGRIDFRALVSDLASCFRKLIRLQQVGARDEARFLDGVGRCGQRYCCRTFLNRDLDEVTLEMARSQQLAHMGSNRITGSCGKLMCCLKYELKDYEANMKNLPQIGEKVKIKEGEGTVIDLNVLNKKVIVALKEGNRVEVDWSK